MSYYRVIVRGRGAFPIDMLRFAEAWPRDSQSAARIENSIGRAAIGELASVGNIELTYPQRPHPHLLERWTSFGWKAYVMGSDDNTVVLSNDPEAPFGSPLQDTAAGQLERAMHQRDAARGG